MLKQSSKFNLKLSAVEPSEPLWKRVPSRDKDGIPLSDFRMIILGLKRLPPHKIQDRISKIQSVLARYDQHIVFADLNLKISLLWVSVKSETRLDLDIAAEIHHLIPEAKLMAAVTPSGGQ